MSTFSKIRVGRKRYFAGVPTLTAKVDSTTAGAVATLPKGAIVLSALSNVASVGLTVSDGTTTATINTGLTAGTAVATDDANVIAGPGVVTITAAVPGFALINYILVDSANGVNS